MKSAINRGPYMDMAIDPCCGGLNWLSKKTFNAVIADDDGVVVTNLLLMENGDYFLMEDGVSRFELE